MPFDESVITRVYPPVLQGGLLVLRWESSAPSTSWYQVYIQGVRVDSTPGLTSVIPAPSGMHEVRIGAVLATEAFTDFSGSFTTIANRATLSWAGGTFQHPDLVGYRVYGGTSPGGSVDYTRPLATILVYEQGDDSDGYGMGDYGSGGYGDVNTFSWTSGPLRTGIWSFAVVPYTAAGNEGTPSTTTVSIAAPPPPPARNAAGKRLTYAYSTSKITLHWLASA